ncbi:putative cell wall binding repeat 2 [Mobiluncus mulieris 28-1]|uniref:cell wall-binding repeat-containing protein n=1 Tax=Mobiluncus mulieris TaxID=2052 RepID=UPI00019F8732|nr:cell wall-binding repeat-containing protein [Mobiluncus mulieris]EEJ54259.1 putative cell wall binding repeat 2 [Mobiluncus mulieris ATCC 35243]EEZ90170.1 putative cell wall binding repeat 2 [Mobiluncus mulieris 28-1]SPX76163.1 N-acetylmuramoyl-L-alanine amidase LytC precursor [Mobiluncus mulieris]
MRRARFCLTAGISVFTLALGFSGLTGASATATPSSDEIHGLGVHSIASGDFTNPDFGSKVANLFLSNKETVFLAGYSDASWPDALAIGPVAGKNKSPLFINRQGAAIPDADGQTILRQAKNVIILGGVGAVPEGNATAWRNLGKKVSRISGADRYATAASIAQNYWPNGAPAVILARGDNPADALAAGPVGTKLNAPILLTQPGSMPAATIAAIQKLHPKRIIVAGGSGAINDVVASQAASLAGIAGTERVYGADRYATSHRLAETFFPKQKDVFVGLQNSAAQSWPWDVGMATGQWANVLQLAPAAGANGKPLFLEKNIASVLELPLDYNAWVFDPTTHNDKSWGWSSAYLGSSTTQNVNYAWRKAALIRAQRGVETLKSCHGKFLINAGNWGGHTYQGDGSVWSSVWNPENFLSSPPHMGFLTESGSNYIRIIHETLRESHGDNYPEKIAPSSASYAEHEGLAIRTGRCVPDPNGIDIPIKQEPTKPGSYGKSTDGVPDTEQNFEEPAPQYSSQQNSDAPMCAKTAEEFAKSGACYRRNGEPTDCRLVWKRICKQ